MQFRQCTDTRKQCVMILTVLDRSLASVVCGREEESRPFCGQHVLRDPWSVMFMEMEVGSFLFPHRRPLCAILEGSMLKSQESPVSNTILSDLGFEKRD